MPWFFGRSKAKKDEDEEEEEYYDSDSSGSWESYYTTSSDEEGDDGSHHSDHDEASEDDSDYADEEDLKDEKQQDHSQYDDFNDSRSSNDLSVESLKGSSGSSGDDDNEEASSASSVSVTAEVIPDGESIDDVFTTDEEITSEESDEDGDDGQVAAQSDDDDARSQTSQHSASSRAKEDHDVETEVTAVDKADAPKVQADIDEENKKVSAEEEETASTFWEKQGLLVLAAEHDRVDIIKAVLVDDEADKERLLQEGIPPLHIAISYGSINATQSLLRMGADPSIRPDVDQFEAFQREQPEDTRVNVPKPERFHEVSAWELAFGNGKEIPKPKKSTSWLFGSSDSNLDPDEADSRNGSVRSIKPVDMPPSKREGIRHAFTAESLRCIGGDEVDRLKQLLDSGMPPSIDIGDRDLYTWAVEMSALKCEELLRPSEQAKYPGEEQSFEEEMESSMATIALDTSTDHAEAGIVHRSRPGEESTQELMNRLDELDSLASALSTSLDNLAEEVSVCHGLLLMGGGASALAAHVKSLKQKRSRKEEELQQVRRECVYASKELARLVAAAGDVGREIAAMTDAKLVTPKYTRSFSIVKAASEDEEYSQMQQLRAQIGATENKVRPILF